MHEQQDVSVRGEDKYEGNGVGDLDLGRPAQPVFVDNENAQVNNDDIPVAKENIINLSSAPINNNAQVIAPSRPRKVDDVLPHHIDMSSASPSIEVVEEKINNKENDMSLENSNTEAAFPKEEINEEKEFGAAEGNEEALPTNNAVENPIEEKVEEQPSEDIPHKNENSTEEKLVDTISSKPYNSKEDELSLEDEMVDNDDENITGEDLESEEDEKKYNEFVDDLTNKLGLAANKIDISGFKVAAPVSASSVLASMNTGKNVDSSDWALSCTKQPISMRKFTGVELKNLNNASNGRRNRQNAATERLGILYEHDTNPNKPDTVEEWSKTISARDEQDIFFAAYDASFHNANHIPYTCDDVKCGYTFISEHIPTSRMWKFDNKEDEAEFLAIREQGPSFNKGTIGRKNPVPISYKFAVAAKDASLWDLNFMYRLVGAEFVQKYQDTVDVIGYIDEIYTINAEEGTLSPINYTKKGTKEADLATNIKNRIIVYNRIIKQLSPDEYGALLAVTRNDKDNGRKIKYVIPECTCPKCGKIISEKPLDGGEYGTIEGQLFTRRPLAIIANI